MLVPRSIGSREMEITGLPAAARWKCDNWKSIHRAGRRLVLRYTIVKSVMPRSYVADGELDADADGEVDGEVDADADGELDTDADGEVEGLVLGDVEEIGTPLCTNVSQR